MAVVPKDCVFSQPGVASSPLSLPHIKSGGPTEGCFATMPSGGTRAWQVQVRQAKPFPSLEEKKRKKKKKNLPFTSVLLSLFFQLNPQKTQSRRKIVQGVL